jgi:hypothetical protein
MVTQPASAARNAAILGATIVTVGVIFLYPTSTNRGTSVHRPGQLAPVGIVAAGPGTTPATGGTGSTGSTGSTGGTGGTSAAPIVVNGAPADTPFGPVQVQIQIRGGKIIAATAIDFPQNGGRDAQINSYAIPVLQQETVAAQNAQINSVSGATYTSNGYLQSLQSALDAAHLK